MDQRKKLKYAILVFYSIVFSRSLSDCVIVSVGREAASVIIETIYGPQVAQQCCLWSHTLQFYTASSTQPLEHFTAPVCPCWCFSFSRTPVKALMPKITDQWYLPIEDDITYGEVQIYFSHPTKQAVQLVHIRQILLSINIANDSFMYRFTSSTPHTC